MPRFCVLGPACVGANKRRTRAGYMAGICANRQALFCSAACKSKDYNARKQEEREKNRRLDERQRASSEKKIARLKGKGHTSCPGCNEPL